VKSSWRLLPAKAF